MHGGAPANRSKSVQNWFPDNNVSVLQWPENSPHLNSIENVWKVMNDKVCEFKPSNVEELERAINDKCVNIDMQNLNNLADSMSRRLKKILDVKKKMKKY